MQSKDFARRKARCIRGLADEDDDALAREMMEKSRQPLPGQLENCEICSKRFTVTAYSKTGPNGGLLCPKCSKEAMDDDKKSKPKKRAPRSGRRQLQSNLLDGIAHYGAMSLVEMCTKVRQFLFHWAFLASIADYLRLKKVAENIDDIEEFGDLPSPLLHRLSQIFSKRRIMTPGTLNLFLRPELHSIDIYDCGSEISLPFCLYFPTGV